MRLVNADSEFTITASDRSGYKLIFKYGIASLVDKYGQEVCEFMMYDIPVSCDVDKIVENLQEASFITGDRMGVSEVKIIMADKAIEIVKRMCGDGGL